MWSEDSFKKAREKNKTIIDQGIHRWLRGLFRSATQLKYAGSRGSLIKRVLNG